MSDKRESVDADRPETADLSAEAFDQEAVLRGDPAAFEALVVSESERLYRVIYRIVNNPEEAQNLLQETFFQAYRRLHSFRGESRLTTWLYSIGINLARASLRKSTRTSPMSEEDIDRLQPEFDRGMFSGSTARWDPGQSAESADMRRIVHEAIARLPEHYRTVVNLRDIEEYSTDDVARMLNMTPGAVRVRLHRARQALRALLDQHIRSGD